MKSCSRDTSSRALSLSCSDSRALSKISTDYGLRAPLTLLGRLTYRSLALGLSRSRSCSFILCLSHSVISYRCAHGLMPSGSLDIVILSSRALMLSCCRTLILAYGHDIMLAWHHAPMISCSHNRGFIKILHFPSPTPSCPHAPSILQSLTCRETLPHCLASRSLIVQVFAQALIRRKYAWIVASARQKGVRVRPEVL